MAGHIYVSDLVLLPEAVITQEHNLREYQLVCTSKNKKIVYLNGNGFGLLEDAICHYFLAPIRNIKYAINFIRNSAVCYVPS